MSARDAVETALASLRSDLAETIASTLDPAPLRWPSETGRRELFGLGAEITYLDWAYMGPVPAAAQAALEWAQRRRAQPWKIERRDFFDETEACRVLFAALAGCTPDDVALVPAASYGIALAGSVIGAGRPGRIIVPGKEHYSNHYAWARLARRPGWSLIIAQRSEGASWNECILAEIERGCAVLAIPACHWSDGALFDIDALAEAARGRGAAIVIDATQTIGAAPFDLATARPDFLVASAYKWLLGPYGLAFLYVAPEHHRAEPIEGHSYHRAGATTRATAIEYTDEYLPGARRFDSGERADFTNLPHAVAGLCQILTWGTEAIGGISDRLLQHAAARAAEHGVHMTARARGSTIAGLRRSGGWPADLPAALLGKHGIKVSLRADSLRLSPSVGNGTQDIDRLFKSLREARLCSGPRGLRTTDDDLQSL